MARRLRGITDTDGINYRHTLKLYFRKIATRFTGICRYLGSPHKSVIARAIRYAPPSRVTTLGRKADAEPLNNGRMRDELLNESLCLDALGYFGLFFVL
jgi:hypothetical protein